MMTFASNWPLPPGPLLNAGLRPVRIGTEFDEEGAGLWLGKLTR